MATNPTNLILEDLVVEPRLEFTLASGSGGDIHGGLTTTEDDEVLLAGDASAVEGGIGGVGLEDLEVPGGDELGEAGLAWDMDLAPIGDRGRTLEVLSLQAVMKYVLSAENWMSVMGWLRSWMA